MAKSLSTVSIRVRQKDIKEGECGDENLCAVALAVRNYFNNVLNMSVEDVEVTSDTVRVKFDDLVFGTTNKLQDFIEKFDDDKSNVKPCTLQLRQ